MPILRPETEKIFRRIEFYPKEPDMQFGIQRSKITKKQLKKFLTERYSCMIASKLVALFDWSELRLTY